MTEQPTVGDLLQPDWRESTKRINGLDLHVVEAGDVGAPLLILLHGFPEFWWAWRHQITPLARAGYHVVVPDMRGYNTSDAPQEVAAYTLDILAADVVALADIFGAEGFHLVGHDWGAVIGWWVAATYPARLDRVVLMDGPHPDVWGKQALKHPTQALRSTYVAFFQLPWVPEATLGGLNFAGLRAMMEGSAKADTFEPGALDRYVEAWSHPGSLTAMLNYYRGLRQRPHGAEPARLAPPTLILWAEDDRFLERHVAEAGLALCEEGELEFVPGVSHWLHIEQPERVNRRIIDWLKDQSRPATTYWQEPRRADAMKLQDAPSSTAARIATGAAAGLLAGLAASFMMDRFQALVKPPSDPDEASEPATVQAADEIVRGVTGNPLPDAEKPVAGQLVHYGLGAALGIGYGIAAEFAPQVTMGAGTAFAAGTWGLLDEATVPAVGLGDPPWQSPPKTQAYALVSHMVFGLSTELTRRLARRVITGRSG